GRQRRSRQAAGPAEGCRRSPARSCSSSGGPGGPRRRDGHPRCRSPRLRVFRAHDRSSSRSQCIVLNVLSRIVPILVLSGTFAGCGTESSGGPNSVIAAFYPLAYAAERIGGPSFNVENLTPPGSEPHDLELTPQEVAAIQNARVVLYLSHGFQPAVSKAV